MTEGGMTEGGMSADELLTMANAGIEMAVPVVWNMGVRFTEVRPGFVAAEVPFEGNGNHFGAMYAGVLATIGEVMGGPMTLASFDMSSYFPLVKSITVDFLKPARSKVTGSMTLDLEEATKLQQLADENGKAEFQLVSELVDEEGTLVARTTGTYQIRKAG
ncbi:MAG TPA: YiiD C-terminal domain-containing protein [Nocardioidaceae bacterium]|nr:YiiD C-terminal domain-containing protein [Nocardioidaceae bacterium]